MILDERLVVDKLLESGFDGFVGVPCSNLSSLINELSDRGMYKSLANEGSCIAYAVGQHLAGKKCGVLMQNSGFANALNPITSLAKTYNIPLYMIIGDRGHDGDEPQHMYTREIVYTLTDKMNYHRVDNILEEDLSNPDGWVYYVEKGKLRKTQYDNKDTFEFGIPIQDAVDVIAESLSDDDIVIATTGYIGRRLLKSRDRFRNFYMVGSMGLATSIARGVADGYNGPGDIVVIDGDGSVLMRPDSVLTAYELGEDGIKHIILDNRSYESTGNQSRLDIDLYEFIKGACESSGRYVNVTSDIDSLKAILKSDPSTVYVEVLPSSDKLPRPTRSPEESKELLMDSIKEEL